MGHLESMFENDADTRVTMELKKDPPVQKSAPRRWAKG